MSSIYNTEPQPTASAILHTTSGDISVELFAKQTPLTCRNFLQLCLDGYYDNTIFHRLVPGFILQGGDPTGTGNGGESIYDGGAFSGDLDPWPMDQRRGRNAGPTGVNFKDEFHSRLKFNRRGLLGMANEGALDTNGSQFFFTLGKTEELNGKNTVFGRVAGDTIYNLAKMGEAEVEEGGDRPLYPTKITGVEILINPFDDMKKRERVAARTAKPAASDKKKEKKRKGGKQLLSFGDEEGDDDVPVVKKAKFDTRIVIDVEEEALDVPKTPKKTKKEMKASKTSIPVRELPEKDEKRQIPTSLPSPVPRQEIKKPVFHEESSPEPEPVKKKSALEKTNDEIAALKASMRRTIQPEPVKERHKTALEQLIPESALRGRKRRPGGSQVTASDEKKAKDLLAAFKAKLEQAGPERKATQAPLPENGEGNDGEDVGEDEEVCDLHFIANCQSCKAWDKIEEKGDSDDEGWMSHSLSFAADKLGKDLSYRKKAEEELVVIDPREKARTLKEEKKAEREARSNSGRAWDQARNAQMSRSAGLAGRGAR
ncbi:putative peptidyl-prolyl isomerase cwc27 protein [Phaeoacremonium minimum UCRPA7]|uniref:peptidylprolyl isomerase n=1 Tax=Phaeoacremonium minimum (strain UCR-PA7) TaxID=1286976 RepID=R8BJ46_PHAM7|nr:putative peptidyl-prolyl isomerase cwc27 protein [Phaeoacremonium minimum UCRPA7]EON99335.1 putative peptidyl-prolyl isomerase cwc27 protein [Phaeoacremonium minimum UCRPA7]